VAIEGSFLQPLETFFQEHPKLNKIKATSNFKSFQEILKERKDLILSTLQDVVNYELWVASGVGCSICNPYYHEKFDAMGAEGIYFDELSYCTNFFKNSNNYLNTFKNMRFIQHNLNVILNMLKVRNEEFGTMNDVKNFKIIIKDIRLKPILDPHNLWKFGLNFGVEYSTEKHLSQRSKVNNCIEEINLKNYSAECQDICMKTNPPNEITISDQQFVINLLMAEYIIDTFWEKNFPGKYTDQVMKKFPLSNSERINPTDSDKNEKEELQKPKPSAQARRRMFRRQNTITIPKSLDVDDPNSKLVTTNDFNLIKYYYERMNELSFKSVFPFIKQSAENVKNFIDFENLSNRVISYKASWLPFPNSMNYGNVRITYDHEFRLLVTFNMIILVTFLFKMFN
jgi:hypothetical protein